MKMHPSSRLSASPGRWGAALLFALLAAPAHADYTATVDPSARAQSLEGWGTSLCWWANVVGGFPRKIQDDYITRIFDARRGLGLNIVRYNIGGGANPNLPDTLQFRARMPGFEPSPGVWDWAADANQRRVLFEARKKGVNIAEAFANSPPWWMTISGSVAGAPDGGANLKPGDFDAFADYLTTVVQHYRAAWGVTFRTLEPMNESTTTYWKAGGRQEGYHIDPRNSQNTDQNTLVKEVKAALVRSHSPTEVSANDDTSIDITVSAIRSYDDAAKAAISQINTHTYGGTERAQLRALAQSLGKRVWMSEHGDGDGTGLTMSRDILADFKQMGASAWVYWQAVDQRGWGMLQNGLRDQNSTAYTLSEKYYVMGQYSRFVRPGDRLIGISDDNSLAAYRPSTGTLTLVTTNSGDAVTDVTYDLSRFTRFGGAVTATRTSATEQWASLPAPAMAGMRFTAPAKAKSVTTYVVTKIW